MALGVLCTVYAFNLDLRDRFAWPKSILLLITAASLYQSDVNLFIALAAIELLLLSQQQNASILIRRLIIRATQYCTALIFYYFTIAKIFMADHHGRDHLVSFDAAGLQNLLDNIQNYFSKMQDFFSPPICILLAIFSLYVLINYLRYSVKQSHRAILSVQRSSAYTNAAASHQYPHHRPFHTKTRRQAPVSVTVPRLPRNISATDDTRHSDISYS